MGLFNNIMGKIFGHAAQAPSDAAGGGGTPESRVQAAQRQGVSVASAVPGAPGAPKPAAGPVGPVDVAGILDKLAASHGEKLDWKHSIVDLMKLVGMDSSLSNRKELAAELKYSGDTSDSAKMNVWLHKEVMKKLAANGGKVPADLLD